jgi:aminoglycoside phosphotransferase (APT) family kinase protein
MDEWLTRLDALGLRPEAVLGKGVEGVVVRLHDGGVAKVWHDRTEPQLRTLQAFYAAVAEAGLPLRTPVVHDVLDLGGRFATVEPLLPGRPLAAPDPRPVVSDADANVMAEVLAALAAVTPTPAMARLPALPGEPPLGTAPGFGPALADLVERRLEPSSRVLRQALPDVDETAAAVTEALRSLPPVPDALVHGDLIAANVLVDAGRASAVLDFGFLTAVGDPAFDVAVSASVHDMYGPHARETEERLDAVLARRFDHDPVRLDVHRAAYALATSTCFSPRGEDGHFAWCVAMLRRPRVREALGV